MKKTLLIAVLCVAASMCTSFVEAPVETETIKVTAKAGDTIWTIAEKQYSKGETRYIEDFVEQIRKENGLTGSKVLQVGQELTIVIHKRK